MRNLPAAVACSGLVVVLVGCGGGITFPDAGPGDAVSIDVPGSDLDTRAESKDALPADTLATDAADAPADLPADSPPDSPPPPVCSTATTFTTATFLTVAGNHGATVTADFDRDGKGDLAATNNSDGTVVVVLSNGDGTARSSVNYPAGTGPSGLLAGDWNGDSKPDLVVVNGGSANISVLLGNGDGTLAAPVNYAVGTSPGNVVSGDWDGDGKGDLVVANVLGASVSVLLGNGDGTFKPAVSVTVPSRPVGLAAADWNGDGRADLVVTTFDFGTFDSSVSVLLGNGNGTFQAPVNRLPGVFAVDAVARDLNGDAKLDLVLADAFQSKIKVALGNGDGTFLAATDYATVTEFLGSAMGLSVADWNGDGKVDLVAAAGAAHGVVSVLVGNGDGTFRAAVNFYAGPDPRDAVRVDWNGDGKPDLAVSSSGGTFAVLAGNGDGTFQAPPDYATGINPSGAVGGDWNHDGKADLAVSNLESNANGSVSVFLGSGNGTLTPGVIYRVGAFPYAVTSGDWNGDGKLDLAASTSGVSGGNGSTLLGNGDGTFGAATSFGTGTASDGITAGDWNGDGKADLAVANGLAPGLTVFTGNGSGTFQTTQSYATGEGASAVITGDWNGDGKADLATVDRDSDGITVLIGGGNSAFAIRPYPAGGGSRGLATGDWNGDGKPDLVTANNDVNVVTVFIGAGDGTFQAGVGYDAGGGQLAVTAGDWNRDGKIDLAVTGGARGLSLLFGNGNGTFQPPIQYFSGVSSAIISADWNGDGKPDLAVGDYGNARVALFLNRCP